MVLWGPIRVSSTGHRVRGLAGSQGTVQWSLDGSMGPNDVLRCHKRGYTGFRGAVYWSLNGSRGSYGILQSHARGCTESPDAGQWSLSGTRWAYTGSQVDVQLWS